MNVATRIINSIPSKNSLYKYKIIAEECCVKKIRGTAKKAEFIFENNEDAEFFERMIKNLGMPISAEK